MVAGMCLQRSPYAHLLG
ncbi:hypothetical protein Nmel_012540, partial [Mimus melanotis]